jgi:oxidoreductase
MRVFITGATGFVGGALARAFVSDGAEVHALVRSTSSRRSLDGINIHYHQGDITVPESLKGAVAVVDVVIHAAGRLGQAGVPEAAYEKVHVEGTRNLLQAVCAASANPRVLHISSPGVLGPIDGEPATENAPYGPSNAYERTKAAAERVALEFAAQGLHVVIARPEFIYGPGDLHVLRLFEAVRNGRFLYIDGGKYFCHPTFIDDGPHAVTFRELGETIAQALEVRPPSMSVPRWLMTAGATVLELGAGVMGRTPPLTRTGAAFFSENRRFSWQRAHDELGYTPQTDLANGMARTIAWYREQRLL